MKIKLQTPVTPEEGGYAHLIRQDGTWKVTGNNTEAKLACLPNGISNLGLDHYRVKMESGTEGTVIRFADLHRHSDNSLLDGMAKIPDIVRATEYAGALTDHGNLYGFLEYYKAMKSAHKKPIIGFEAYTENLEGELRRNHLILLAKNSEGYKNIVTLCSEASEHIRAKPHVTWEMLEKYHEGVIATSACLAGLIPRYLLAGMPDQARKTLERYLEIFGDDFYLEIQRHGLEEENTVNPAIMRLAKEFGVKCIATTDAHYLREEDKSAHEILLCMQTKKTLDEPHLTFGGTGYHVHTSEEMERLFADCPEALDATLEIADQCEVSLDLGQVSMPVFPIPAPYPDDVSYFRALCEEGYDRRFKGTPSYQDPVYRERYEYEMDTIVRMGYPSYFLIVHDYISWAREQGIYVGPGRGSAAGSLLAYCLGITDLDPVKYNLLFERFLNPERVSMPDIDVDFEHSRRDEVYQYVCRKYGEDQASHIITFGTMAAKMAIRDTARVTGFPASFGAKLASMIPAGGKSSIADTLEANPDFRALYDSDPDSRRVIDAAMALEGCKRHASQHACGVIVAPGPVHDWVPTSMEMDRETGTRSVTAQVTMTECEELGLLKMDFLGLKNMTVIHEVRDGVVQDCGLPETFKYQDIPLTDRETYRMLARGMTGGVFQLESAGMTKLIREMYEDIDELPDSELPQCFERLIAAVALYRPGPMESIPEYMDGMRNRANVRYDHESLKDILGVTYGVIVFQEQVIQIVQKLAGFPGGRADLVRKAMGKKKKSVMEKEREVFLYGNQADFDAGKDAAYVPGCAANGIPEETAKTIWAKMERFAEYAFNRSHAACYAYLAYITAYMNCHWPVHFYAATLNAFVDNSDKFKLYLSQAIQRGLKILPPDINRSEEWFKVEDGAIRYGLRGIIGFNKVAANLVDERNTNGPFPDPGSLYFRMADRGEAISSMQYEHLVFSGALDRFSLNRRQLESAFERMRKGYRKTPQRVQGQMCLYGDDEYKFFVPPMSEYSQEHLMEKERESLGFYLTGHPADIVAEAAKAKGRWPKPIAELGEENDIVYRDVFVIGQVQNLIKRFTKNGDAMFSFDLTDRLGSVKCVVFPSDVPAAQAILSENTVIGINGRVQDDEDFGRQIVVKDAVSRESIMMNQTEALLITVRDKANQTELLQILHRYKGDVPIYLDTPGNSKRFQTNLKCRITPGFLDKISSWEHSPILV